MRSTSVAEPNGDQLIPTACANQLLEGLSAEAARAFELIRQTRTYPVGGRMFTEGGAPEGVFILRQGKVKLVLSADEERAQIIRVAEPGEVLALSACIAGEVYEVTAEALSPCQIDFISRPELLKFVHGQPEVCFRVVQLLGQTLHESYEQFCLYDKSPTAATRLAYVLLKWGAEGVETREGIRCTVPLTHARLARMIGTSRETVTRTLAKFKSRHIIRLEGSTLLIRKKGELEKLIKFNSHAFLPN